jgi:hypothetical protein
VKANTKAKAGAKKAPAKKAPASSKRREPVKAAVKRRGPATLDSDEARRRINIRWARPGARKAQSEAVLARLAAKAEAEAEAEREREREAKRKARKAKAKAKAKAKLAEAA